MVQADVLYSLEFDLALKSIELILSPLRRGSSRESREIDSQGDRWADIAQVDRSEPKLFKRWYLVPEE